MIKANPTIFKFYLSMLDSFSEYLSQKYSESSLDNPDHYKTIIIQKIVRMFHTLEELVKESKDEVSTRCVLRAILDNVTVFSFIYERDDEENVLFRHYLYALDGLISYKENVVNGVIEKDGSEIAFSSLCENVISQIQEKLSSHPYLKVKDKTIKKIVRNRNWRYWTIQNPRSLSYLDLYILVGYEEKLAKYYQSHLSQFSHGLCFSNVLLSDEEMMMKIELESIPIEERFVKSIVNTFPGEDLKKIYLKSSFRVNLFKESTIDTNELNEFAKALIDKDRQLLI